MSRITMSLENDFEGRVLASFDLDEFANKVRADAIDEITKVLCNELDKGYIFMNKHQIIHFAEELKEQNNDQRRNV